MWRRLFPIAAAVSAVLFVGACGLWARSVWPGMFNWPFGDPPRFLIIGTSSQLIFRLLPPDGIYLHGWPTEVRGWQFLGFGYYRMIYGGPSHETVTVPFWFLVLATAVAPLLWFRAFRRLRVRRARASSGLCPTCGYDLRGSPDRCAECGAVREPAKEAG